MNTGLTKATRRRTGVIIASVLVGLAATSHTATASPPDGTDPTPTETVAARRSTVTVQGTDGLSRAPGNSPSLATTSPQRTATREESSDDQISADQAIRIAERYLERQLPRTRSVRPAAELRAPTAVPAADGGYAVRFSQLVEGVEVFGGGATARIARNGEVLSVANTPDPPRPTAGLKPTVSAESASATAVQHRTVSANSTGGTVGTVVAEPPTLVIYDPGLVRGDPNGDRLAGPVLAWDVTTTEAATHSKHRSLVDATTGAVLLSFSEGHDARERSVCDAANDYARTVYGNCYRRRDEGGGRTYLADADAAYAQAGFFYDYFRQRFGRDSFDGRGGRLRFITRACLSDACSGSAPLQNAAWIGEPYDVVVLGDGWAVDDVVFHELTHALTDHTAQLLYYAESGAINESLSDVFGELLDQEYPTADDGSSQSWLIGEGLRNISTPLRSMKNPPATGDPDRLRSGYYSTSAADNYGIHTNSGINNKAAFLIASGGTFNGRTISGIGRAKTALLYYEVLSGLLTPASDYQDLASMLPQACKNLVRIATLRSSDCVSVSAAVAATEMNLAPLKRRTAAVCTSGSPHASFTAGAEDNPMVEVTGATNAPRFGRSRVGSVSGRYSYSLQTPAGNSTKQESWLRTRYPVYISRQAPTFLYFSHSFSFQSWTDHPQVGGVIEYSLDGRTWRDLGTRAETVNGYNGTISDPTNPLNGRRGFVQQSQGFEQVRVPISFLAGRTAHFRWRFAGDDDTPGNSGWIIDGISVHACGSSAPRDTSMATGRFTPVTPRRVFDTRSNAGSLRSVPIRRRAANTVLRVDMTDLPGFRFGDHVNAVVLNVTAVDADWEGFVRAYPCNRTTTTSTVNIRPGIAAANNAIVPLSGDGTVCFYTSTNVNILADITGYFSNTRTSASTYRPIEPKRVFDTRTNRGSVVPIRLGKRNAGETTKVSIGRLPLFRSGDRPVAVAINVTTTQPETDTFVVAYPCATGRPNTSTVNVVPWTDVSNSAFLPVDRNGDICIWTMGRTHLVLDITGYFTAGGAGLRFSPISPTRIVDSREGFASSLPTIRGVRSSRSTTAIKFDARTIFGGTTPTAVAANVTSVNARNAGHLSAWPCGTRRPITSINNYVPGSTARASATVLELGTASSAGQGCVFTWERVDVVIDATGFFW